MHDQRFFNQKTAQRAPGLEQYHKNNSEATVLCFENFYFCSVCYAAAHFIKLLILNRRNGILKNTNCKTKKINCLWQCLIFESLDFSFTDKIL
jgi:hypothetical protein